MSDDVAMESVDSSVSEQADAVSQQPESSASEPSVASSPAAETQGQSVWTAFRALPEFQGQDDTSIARRLYASMEREKAASRALAQYQQYIPYAQQYLQHREPFEKWLASQQQPSQPAQQAPQPQKKWWSPPEVRESYRQYLTRDDGGREIISPDAPLDAKHALYEYQKYKADFAQKFLTDPEAALGPMVQEIAQRQADEIVQARMSEAAQTQYVSALEQANADWLYDEQGQPTPEGLAAQKYIAEAGRIGIQSPEAKWEYATKMIERDLLDRLRNAQAQGQQTEAFEQALQQPQAQQVAQAPDAASQAQRDIEFLRREASRNPSRSAGHADPRVPQAPLTFEQRLTRQLQRDGIA